MSIYRKAVDNPVTTTLVFVTFAILGIFSLMNLSINNFPDFDSNNIMVMTAYPGASAEDIETNLTKVLENALNGVSDLKNITSRSKENISIIALEFEYGIDIEEATNNVRDKLDMVSSRLPDGASTPNIFKFSADDMPILIYSATADKSVPALEKILDDKVATPLARVSGVGTVSVGGAPKREVQIYCDPNKLEAYGISITTISNIIAAENRNVPSGNIDMGSDTYTLRIEKEFDDPSEMLDIVVGYSGGKAVYLRDVATVNDGLEERSQEAYTNGVRGAQIVIQKQAGANTVNIIKKVKKMMTQIEKTLPSDIKITVVVDNSRNIINSINSLLETILITFLVVALVVFLFLGRWRSTFIILLAIPISLLASIIYLFATGNTLNIISMSALSIAIGMVVDDAIVVLENISSHLERGEKPKEAAVHGTQEVGISVVASTLTMLAVFLPLTMIQGMAGIMFRQLGWIVSIIMIVSTCGALTLIPMLCSRFLRLKGEIDHGKFYNFFFGNFNKFLAWLTRGYGKIVAWCVRHKIVVISIAMTIFVASILLYLPVMKTEYFPQSDSGRISATIQLPVGTAQEVTRELAADIYRKTVETIPEIRVYSYSLGEADTDNSFAAMQNNGTHLISVRIDCGSMEERERTSFEIADIYRGILAQYPEIRKFTVSEGGGMGGSASVKLEVYGYDFAKTDAVAGELASRLREYPQFSEALVSRDEYTPEYQVDFDRTKLAINGLNSTTAASTVSAAIKGATQSFYREDGDEYDIRVRYAPEFRTKVEDIENIVIYSPSGAAIKVKDLGTVVETATPPQIERKNRERLVTVTGYVGTGYALSDAVEVAQQIINECDVPSELSVVIAGDVEDQAETFTQLITLLILMVILVYIVMASQFESFMSPFVIMFSIPFALTGVAIGCMVTNTAIGVMALIGLIILMGIVVKNGIVMIDYTILLQERGYEVKEAMTEACMSRLRPILMTTLTTVLGMIPMAIGTGEGSEMWRSLGITVSWGLTISSLVTLVIIPTIYTSFVEGANKRKARKAARKAKKLATAAK